MTPRSTLSMPIIPALDVLEVTPEKIINQRLVKKGNVVVTQILVQWTGLRVLNYMGGLLHFKDEVSFGDSQGLAWCFSAGGGGGSVTTMHMAVIVGQPS
jgi:hypothetical protein